MHKLFDRRQLLLASTSSLLLAGFASAMPSDLPRRSSIERQRSSHFKKVYQIWASKGLAEPELYLNRRLLHGREMLTLTPEFVKRESISDFEQGDTIDIDGFILSKIEAAVMATLGAA